MTPILMITRPVHVGQATADAFRAAISLPFDIVLSPLVRIETVDPPAFNRDPDHVIFTSANAVAQVGRIGLERRAIAWCVGARTAQAASDAGFQAHSVDGTGHDLLQRLRDENVSGTILHVHGRKTYVDFARELGAHCTGVCVYDQVSMPLSSAALAALTGERPVIVPLYSPNTARTFLSDAAYQAPNNASVWFVAISQHTADAILNLRPDARCTISRSPDQTGMIDATRQVIDALTGDSSP